MYVTLGKYTKITFVLSTNYDLKQFLLRPSENGHIEMSVCIHKIVGLVVSCGSGG